MLHGLINRIAVMNQEGDALCITPIGANTDVVTIAKNHNITRLPLLGVVQIAGEGLCITAEEDIQIIDAAKVDVGILTVDVRIGSAVFGNICVYHVFE